MRKFLINVDGSEYEVEVEEIKDSSSNRPVKRQASRPAPAAPKAKPAQKAEKKEVKVAAGSEVISAPMPGTILSINVNEGDEVKAGDILLILEAMKMENEILAPRDGKIAGISTTKGASVNTGEQLVVIE